MNPFLNTYGTYRETIPFHLIGVAEIEEALIEGMKREKREVEHIVENPEPPTFENTIEALESTGRLLDCATTVMYNLASAETSDALDELTNKYAPILSAHSNEIMLNKKLFERVQRVYAQRETFSGEALRLLNNTYEAFEPSGATLSDEAKEEYKNITSELSQLSLTFSQNNLKETNDFCLLVEDEEKLSGLPETQIEQAAAEAKSRGKEGWAFTLKAPSYVPFMTYADCRELRKQLHMAYGTRCTHGGATDNFEVVRRIVNLRRQKARLLGYETYADFVLRRRMAQNTEKVYELLHELIANYREPALREVEAVATLARREQGEDFVLQAWDFAYYSNKLKRAEYDLDSEMLRPYFELERVKRGVFGLATKLYGITFREEKAIPVYHPDVVPYEVLDADGTYLGVLYTDFHPRDGKQGGAWMTSYKDQWLTPEGEDHRPHVSVTMNFTKPTATKPALLTFEEVETFLHEFGHALHGLFSKCKYRSLSGTNVFWDFVELPSQFMENYAVEPDFLRTFARHYQTDEPLPEALLQRITKSRNFNVAYACMRQVSFGLLDMAYYTLSEPLQEDIRAFERAAWQEAQLLPPVPECCMSTQFGHIMSGGYAAGYYSYKWAEVLDADAFEHFKERGVFSREAADSFRENVLSRGSSEDPMTLYLRFRGKAPSIQALLKRNGLA